MKNIYCYKINRSFALPYQLAIEKSWMEFFESKEETVASSRIYFICRIRKPGFLSRIFSKLKPRPEVLYVGETFNKAARYACHEKLLKATRMISDFDELRIYFIQVKGVLGGEFFGNNTLFGVMDELRGFHSKEATWLLERLYIELFKPILNSRPQIAKKIEEDKFVKQKLLANEIFYVYLDIGMNEPEYQFWSPGKKSDVEGYYFDLQNGILQEGLPNLFPD